jgi:SAM-dependent methyltransferase
MGVQAVNLDRLALRESPADPQTTDGYLDLLPPEDSGSDSLGQRLMRSRGLPLIYERLWRPVGVRLLTGPGGAVEDSVTDEFLALQPGDRVLDLACGPGNITRRLARSVGASGLIVGVDASATMLAQAVRDTRADQVSYVRADAAQLPFRSSSFDAVCCYAALYLIDDPFAAIAEMIRVLAPGGRVAVLTSCHRGPDVLRPAVGIAPGLGGIRLFGREEITSAFAGGGLADIRQRVTGFAQFVGGRSPRS